MKHGYFAFEGFEKELESEITFKTKKQATQTGRLFLFDEDLDLVWAQLRLKNLEVVEFDSISQAAKLLRERKRHWASYSFHLHRRTELIQEQVRAPKLKKMTFMENTPENDWGFWCLLDEKKLLLCDSTGSFFPLGLTPFEEDKVSPPSRAYLKLWETFTIHTEPPGKGDLVLDLGSCPGGWTWVLQSLGCNVISVDKAPLDPKVSKLPRIQYIKKDAFKLDPETIKNPKWLLSDIICEPARLYELVQSWMRIHPDLTCVCTIKYKGRTDFKTTALFEKIPGSRIIHLNHNKHEVTWIRKKNS